MKKHLLFSCVAAFSTAVCFAQFSGGGGEIKTLHSTLPISEKNTKSDAASDAAYTLPKALSNVGTISKEDNAVCNYLFPNDHINQDAYMLASGNKAVTFKDASASLPTAWLWTAPGTAEQTSTEQNLTVHYVKEGVFDFPSLSVTTGNGNSTYSPALKMKSGGTSEITTIDTREYGVTYQFGAFAYGNGGGFVGGTNKVGIVGWGNLFMLGTDDAYLEGINIYLHHKPQKYAEDAKLLVQVWYPSITEYTITFRSIPIEASFVSFKDIKDANDGVWVPTQEAAVANIKFDTPVDLYGKTLLFVSVEGFGTDPSAEDFCLLTDITGSQLPQEQMSNLLAHNSFGRINGENDYLRPISYYGGGTGSFAICPVIRTIVTGSVDNAAGKADASFKASVAGGNLIVKSTTEGQVKVFDAMGRLLSTFRTTTGTASFPAPDGNGLFIVQGPDGQTAKVIK